MLSHSNDRRTESLARQSVNDLPNRCAIFNSLTLIAVKEMCTGVSGGLEPSGQSIATLHRNDPRWTHGVMRWFEREKRALGRTSRCYQDRVGSSGLLTSHGDREHRKRPVRRQHQRPSPSCRSLGGVVTNDVQKGDLMIDDEHRGFLAPGIRYEPDLCIGHNDISIIADGWWDDWSITETREPGYRSKMSERMSQRRFTRAVVRNCTRFSPKHSNVRNHFGLRFTANKYSTFLQPSCTTGSEPPFEKGEHKP